MDVWGEHEIMFNSGSTTSGVLGLVNLSTGFSGNDFAVDDLRLVATSAVAVPAPLLLLASALGALGLRRRRPA
jgi:hypothetical protein